MSTYRIELVIPFEVDELDSEEAALSFGHDLASAHVPLQQFVEVRVRQITDGVHPPLVIERDNNGELPGWLIDAAVDEGIRSYASSRRPR